MTTTIAVAGKGGTGKTTIAALLIKLLAPKGVVLAIDGDPSTNLHISLGLPLNQTIGNVREEMLEAVKAGRYDSSMPKMDYVSLKISEALVESERVDLLAMGRPEGPGCYCASNEMLRFSIDRLAKNYDYVVIDCEAGMEHISRQTTQDIDILLIISDPTMKGIITAARMKELIAELRTHVGRICLIVNRSNDALPPELAKAIEQFGLELIAILPQDPQMLELDATGAPLTELAPDSPLGLGVAEIAKKVGLA
jgi:CO dehydrogenase maturation factor